MKKITMAFNWAKKLPNGGGSGSSSNGSSSSTFCLNPDDFPPLPPPRRNTTPPAKRSYAAVLASASASSSPVPPATDGNNSGSGSSTTATTTNDSTTAAANPAATPPKPGILTVTLHEAAGLSLPSSPPVPSAAPAPTADSSPGAAGSSSGTPPTPPTTPTPTTTPLGPEALPYARVEAAGEVVLASAVEGTADGRAVWAGGRGVYRFDVAPPPPPSGVGGKRGGVRVRVEVFVRRPRGVGDVSLGVVKVEVGEGRKDGVRWVGVEGGTGTGRVKIGVWFSEKDGRGEGMSMADFEPLVVLGRGVYGKVMQVRKRDTGRVYALKAIAKTKAAHPVTARRAMDERRTLTQLGSPFLAPLKFAFHSPDKLYLVMSLVPGGELWEHLRRSKTCLDAGRARLYTAEVVCGLEFLHGAGVAYRDMKTDNVLLDARGHIVLCDFGLCRRGMLGDTDADDADDGPRANSLYGSSQHLAPEIVQHAPHGRAVDWWTLGVLLYTMLTLEAPFYSRDGPEAVARRVLAGPIGTEKGMARLPAAARDLVERLLDRDAATRLGARGAWEVKAHEFLRGLDWGKVLRKEYETGFAPDLVDQLDVGNFCRKLACEVPQDSVVEPALVSRIDQELFVGFSYARPDAELEGLEQSETGSVEDPVYFPEDVAPPD